MPLTENDDVVEALPADRSDQTLTIRIDAPRFDAPDEIGAKDAITVPKQIARRGIVRKCLTHLLSGPPGLRGSRDVEVEDTTPVVGHDEETVEDAERRRWNHEEVDRSP